MERAIQRNMSWGARFVGVREGGHLRVGHQEEVMSAIEAFLRPQAARDAPGAGSPVR